MITIITSNGTAIEIDDSSSPETLSSIFDELPPIEREVITARLQTILHYIAPPMLYGRTRGARRPYSQMGEN